jgi:hypothetical protein
MKGKRSSEEQLMRIWPEAETRDNVREVRRQHNIAGQTFRSGGYKCDSMDFTSAREPFCDYDHCSSQA